MAESWSIIIEEVGGKVVFRPDLPGAQAGQPLGANNGDNVTWNNRTDEFHHPVATEPAGEFLTDDIPAGEVSSPIFNISKSVTYKCAHHEGEVGSIVVATTQKVVATTHQIEITAMNFPPNTEIAKGDTVEWTNKMDTVHTVTADNGEFDSGNLAKDASFSHTFETAGAVAYHCNIHTFMTGTVTVS